MREGDLWPQLREYWHPVTLAENVLADKPFSAKLLDEQIVVCRLGNEYAAFFDLCIHRGTPLSLGWIEGEEIICSYHGWSYNCDGICTKIPSIESKNPIPKKARLTRYQAQERYGIIWVCMSNDPQSPIPELPALEDTNFHVTAKDERNWLCSAARAIENFIDYAHFAWIHEGILGDRSRPEAPDVDVVREGVEIKFEFGNKPDGLHEIPHTNYYRMICPFSICLTKVEEDGRIESLNFVCTPVSANECTRIFMIARNHSHDFEKDGGTEKFLDLVAEQDRLIVENQRPQDLPLDLSEELHLKGPDAGSLVYRRALRERGLDE